MASTTIPYLGEICALLAALCWSFATILFRRSGERVPPLALNLFKCVLGMVLFGATLLVTQNWPDRPVTMGDRALLVVSGAIGIGLSDTLFFMTLNRVGAGLQAIITTTYSPSIIILSILFLGESLKALQGIGVFLILAAVLSVSLKHKGGPERRTLVSGIVFGVLAMLSQAVSIVMVKPLLNVSPLVWANCWRLAGGLVASALVYALLPGRRRELATLREPRNLRVMLPGTFLGTYVALLLWLGGMKYTQASIASALNQTATLWTFLFASLFLHEPADRWRLVALGLGLAGIALVTFG